MTPGNRGLDLGRSPTSVSESSCREIVWTDLAIEVDIEYTLYPRFEWYLALSLGVADIPTFLFFDIW